MSTHIIGGDGGVPAAIIAALEISEAKTCIIVVEDEQQISQLSQPLPIIIQKLPEYELGITENPKRRRKSQRRNPFKHM